MKKFFTSILMAGLLLPAAFNITIASAATTTIITNLKAVPNTISVNAQGQHSISTINMTLLMSTEVTVAVLNSSGIEVRRILTKQLEPAENFSVNWDGTDNAGGIVPIATYDVKVMALSAGNTDTKDINIAVINGGGTASAGALCDNFSDVSQSDPYCAAIDYAKTIGAMTGNADGTFDPNGLLQRDQIVKIVLAAFKLYKAQTNYCGSGNPFPDVTPTAWSYQYICQGKTLSMITGYKSGADAGFYRPARTVNRAELLALMLRNLTDVPGVNSNSYRDVSAGLWYSGYANYSQTYNLFTGTYLYPTATVQRKEVADILYKLHVAGKI